MVLRDGTPLIILLVVFPGLRIQLPGLHGNVTPESLFTIPAVAQILETSRQLRGATITALAMTPLLLSQTLMVRLVYLVMTGIQFMFRMTLPHQLPISQLLL